MLLVFEPGNENAFEKFEFFFVISCNSAKDRDRNTGSFLYKSRKIFSLLTVVKILNIIRTVV